MTPLDTEPRSSIEERTRRAAGGAAETGSKEAVPASRFVPTQPAGRQPALSATVVDPPAQVPGTLVRARRAIGAIILVAAGAGGVLWYSGFWAPQGPAEIRLVGVVSANEVTVAAKVAGRIEQLQVKEGDTVTPGSTVATLERRELNALRMQQLAMIGQLTSQLERGRDVVSLETTRTEGRIDRSSADLDVARAQQRQAAAEVADLRVEATRFEQLFAQQLVSRRDLDRARAEVAVAEARLNETDNRISAMTAELSLAELERGRVGLARRDVDGIRAQIDQAQAQLANVDAQLAEMTVAAPIAGVVSLQVARAGEVVRPGDPIVTLVDLDDTWVRAEVEESYAGGVAIGDTLDVELASGERRTGRVTFIAPEAGFATSRDVSRVKRDVRTFAIKVALPNDGRRLHAGMTAFVLLPTPTSAARPGR